MMDVVNHCGAQMVVLVAGDDDGDPGSLVPGAMMTSAVRCTQNHKM